MMGSGGIHGTGGIMMGLGGMMMGSGGIRGTGGIMMGFGGMMMGSGGSGVHDAGATCHAAGTIPVVNSGMTAYLFDGASAPNPDLTLCRGSTYVFAVNAPPNHPFWIKTAKNDTGTGNAFSTGVTGNGTMAGDVTFAVPTSAPDTLFYDCQTHAMMSGTIHIIN